MDIITTPLLTISYTVSHFGIIKSNCLHVTVNMRHGIRNWKLLKKIICLPPNDFPSNQRTILQLFFLAIFSYCNTKLILFYLKRISYIKLSIMSKFNCEKCGKEFHTKSQYTQHQKRKTPCVNETKIRELVDNTVDEKNLSSSLSSAPSSNADKPHIDGSSFEQLQKYYDEILNLDKSTYTSTNDEPTPIGCICEMIRKIPEDLWTKQELSILDPCCGNGNFHIPIFFELLKHHDKKTILENILEFNDLNGSRLENVKKVFCNDKYNLQITNQDFLTQQTNKKYDLIVANPPYAKLLENGKRASKNHNLIKDFIEKSLAQLKPNGYLLFITPDNWMSYADRNVLIEIITSLQIIHLDIHTAKKYFKKIGSSFTWYIIQNCAFYKNINVFYH